ncbi:MAG: WD40 repeat domain-containing protein, partial [Polyangiales bacterium]
GHTDSVTTVSINQDGSLLASGSRDGTLELWSLPSAQQRISLRAVTGTSSGYAFTASGHLELFGADAALRDIPICRVGAVSVPYELCEERYSSPGLYVKAMLGDTTYVLP